MPDPNPRKDDDYIQQLRLPPEWHDAMLDLADTHGRSLHRELQWAIYQYLQGNKKSVQWKKAQRKRKRKPNEDERISPASQASETERQASQD